MSTLGDASCGRIEVHPIGGTLFSSKLPEEKMTGR